MEPAYFGWIRGLKTYEGYSKRLPAFSDSEQQYREQPTWNVLSGSFDVHSRGNAWFSLLHELHFKGRSLAELRGSRASGHYTLEEKKGT